MQTLEWHQIEKTTKDGWGTGPWQTECDKRQWEDPATGLPCLIVRHLRSGHWCAYVGVAPGHPLYGMSYGSCALRPTPCTEDLFCDHRPDCLLAVHGGLTFSGPCQKETEGVCHIPDPGEEAEIWWFGADCAHSGDLSPGTAALLRRIGADHSAEFAAAGYPEIYRTQAYAQRECARLAAQLHAFQWSLPAQ